MYPPPTRINRSGSSDSFRASTCVIVFERRYCVSGAKDRTSIIGEIDFQCRLHLFPSEAGDRILHQGYVVSEFCGVTHRRVDAGIRLLANHDQLMDTITAVRSISEQIQLVSYLRSNAYSGVVGKRLIQW